MRLWRDNLRPGMAELKLEKVNFKAQAGQFKARKSYFLLRTAS